MKRLRGEKMVKQADQISEGDIVFVPGERLGIVVGIYGLGYCEVLINRDSQNAKILPFRKNDLKKLPAAIEQQISG